VAHNLGRLPIELLAKLPILLTSCAGFNRIYASFGFGVRISALQVFQSAGHLRASFNGFYNHPIGWQKDSCRRFDWFVQPNLAFNWVKSLGVAVKVTST